MVTKTMRRLNRGLSDSLHFADDIRSFLIFKFIQFESVRILRMPDSIWKFVLILIVICAGFISQEQLCFAKGWEQIRNENDIMVYRQESGHSDILAFKGVTRINADMDTVMTFISDNSIADTWIPMVGERRTVQTLSPCSRIEYTHVEMPWPLIDRYFITLVNAEQNLNGSIRVRIKSMEKPPFIEEDKILGVFLNSSILLEPIAEGDQTRMTVEIRSDLKGLIPKWLINKMQAQASIDFFSNLITELKTRKINSGLNSKNISSF